MEMAKISAKMKYEKFYDKKIKLMEKLENLKRELAATEKALEYAEFMAWKEEKKTLESNQVVMVGETGADAESDNEMIIEALRQGNGGGV